MPLVYSTGSIVDSGGVAINNMTTVQATLRDKILLNSAWTLQEEFDQGTEHWVVLKCSAGGSGLSGDYYVALRRLATGNIYWHLFETWTVGGGIRTMGRYAPLPSSGAVSLDPTTGGLTATITTTALGTINQQTVWAPAASIVYSIFVYDDHLVVLRHGTTTNCHYIGAIESMVDNAAVNDPLPLVQNVMGSSTSGTAASNPSSSTRHPRPATATVASYALGVDGIALGHFFGINGDTSFDVPDRFTVTPSSYRMVCVMNSATVGRIRGLYKPSIRRLPAGTPTGIVAGDTVTINGTRWAYMGASGVVVDTGMAA